MSAPGRTPRAPAWQVTSQQETTEISPAGQLVKGMTVRFTTAQGVAGSVFVPMAAYTPDGVRAAIAPQAAILDTVQGMTG